MKRARIVFLIVGVMLVARAAMVRSRANAAADLDHYSADRKTLAALDTQYQAAVKKNDAATMDRLHIDELLGLGVEAEIALALGDFVHDHGGL